MRCAWSSRCGAMGLTVSAAAGRWVQFLAWRSGLRIQHCIAVVGCNSGLDSIPGLGTPYAMGQPKEEKTKEKKKKTRYACIRKRFSLGEGERERAQGGRRSVLESLTESVMFSLKKKRKENNNKKTMGQLKVNREKC